LFDVQPDTIREVWTAFTQLGGTSLPLIGDDQTIAPDFIRLLTPAVASTHLTSVAGSAAGGPGYDAFVAENTKLTGTTSFNGSVPYAYDSVMELALAIEAAGSVNAAKVNKEIALIADPPGQDISTFAAGVAALKHGTKIHWVGAGGPSGYDAHHNSAGAFSAFQVSAAGTEQVIGDISVTTLIAAAAGKLT
jgi:ABC-type branched-subunit amino acid transport system substrate-binding protein